MTDKTTKIKVCHGTACQRNFSPYSLERAKNDKDTLGLDHVECEECPCLGKCDKGPNVVVEIDGKKQLHSYVSPVEIGKIIRNLGRNGKKQKK